MELVFEILEHLLYVLGNEELKHLSSLFLF